MRDWSDDDRALAVAEDRVDAMDAKALAAEVARLVETPDALRVADPVWVSALIKTVDFEPRRLPATLRREFWVSLLKLPAPCDLLLVRGLPDEVRRAQAPAGARFQSKVSELVDAALYEFVHSGRDPWMAFAERLTSHLLDVEHAVRAQPAPDRHTSGPVRVGEITEPRVRPPAAATGVTTEPRNPLPGC